MNMECALYENSFQEKADTYAESQQLRADEITALEKAIEIISSGDLWHFAPRVAPTKGQ